MAGWVEVDTCEVLRFDVHDYAFGCREGDGCPSLGEAEVESRIPDKEVAEVKAVRHGSAQRGVALPRL